MSTLLSITPRRYSLIAFFALTFMLSWSLWIPAALASHGLVTFAVSPMVTGILGAFAPTLAGLIMTALEAGWPGLRSLGRRLWLWRVGLQWYLFVLLWPALLSLCVTGVAIRMGKPAPDFANPPFVALYPIPPAALQIGWWLFLPFVFLQQMTIGSALGEELGWRGYALPRLQARTNALSASIILGLLWGIWHLPLYWTVGDARASMSVGWLLAGLVLEAILYTWVFNHTQGSLLPALLFHAATAVTSLFLAAVNLPWVSFVVTLGLVMGIVVQERRKNMKQLLHLMLIGLFVMTSLSCRHASKSAEQPVSIEWPTAAWSTSTPEEQGFDSATLAAGLAAIRQKGFNLHSVLLVRNGKLLLDAYFYPYDGKTVHNQASVTKSVMTTLIAIAANQGKLNLDDSLLSFFPERTIANRNAAKERITVRHLVSMASGLDCTAANDEQTLREMEQSNDFVQFTLDRKLISEPGKQFVYCSPGMHLLSAILQEATGQTTLEFAQENLFAPLGITEVIWPTDPQGYTHGWGDLYLHPRDTAKLGLLWLNHGEWAGKQIVPSAWVKDAVKSHLKTGGNDDYGYGWWVTGDDGEYAAIGRGGQRIQVWPALNMFLVMNGGGVEYDDINALLSPAFVDPAHPLPANSAAVADLASTLGAAAAPPAPNAVTTLPAIAQALSGKTFAFTANPLGMAQMALNFGAPTEATMQIAFGEEQPTTWLIGLDGLYHLFPGKYDLPQGVRGTWSDGETFLVEYDNIANTDHYFLRFHFAGDRVMVEGQETAHELSVRFEGQRLGP